MCKNILYITMSFSVYFLTLQADGKASAQFEHTLVISDVGVEILTARLPNSRADFK
jgi:methionine aminopeptidase